MRTLCEGRRTRVDDGLPGAEIGLLGVEPEPLAHHPVESLVVEAKRDLVDRADVGTLDHAVEIHVAEERDLALDVGGDGLLAPANEDVGLDPDLHELAHRMLGRLGLELAGGGDEGHQGEVDDERVVPPHLLAELPDRLEERQRFDVADGAADLGDHHVVSRSGAADGVLDLVGDVRDDLHGAAQVLAPPLLVDDRLVDPPGGDVVLLGERAVDEPLVVSEVEIGLGPVVGHEHFAVLKRRHGTRVHIDVRVELLHRDVQPALHEQPSK